MKLKKAERATVNNSDNKSYYAALGIKPNRADDKRRNLLSRVAEVRVYRNDNMVDLYDARGRFIDQMHYREALMLFGDLM